MSGFEDPPIGLSLPGTGRPAAAAFARSLEDGPEPLDEEPELLDPEDELPLEEEPLELLSLDELSELELSEDEELLSLDEESLELLSLEDEELSLEEEDEELESLELDPEEPEELSPLEGNGRGGSPRGALAMGPLIPRTVADRTRRGSETRVPGRAP